MKIQDMCKKTGISRRTIHFYIKEKLITPAVNPENGYYDFDVEDYKRLILVREFRTAGLSLSIIRSMLNIPSSSGYYLRLHQDHLRKEVQHLQETIESLDQILENLPVNTNFENLYQISMDAHIPPTPTIHNYNVEHTGDNELVNQFLWQDFLPDGILSEYQQYLWKKFNSKTSHTTSEDYRKLIRFLKSLSQEEADAFFSARAKNYEQIAALTGSDYNVYVDKMKSSIEHLLQNKEHINHWKKMYNSYTCPNARIFDASINDLVTELSPLFSSYISNIHIVCDRLYQWLHSEEGADLLHKLETELNGYLNLEHCHHGELEALASFHIISGKMPHCP